MDRLLLSAEETSAIHALLDSIAARHASAEAPDFLDNTALYAHDLPHRVRAFLSNFKMRESSAACVISGYPIDDAKIGQTPSHWKDKSPATRCEEMLFVLYGSLLGDVFGWSTQQDGYIVHDVAPIKGHEHEQINSASEQTIWWHTEDAFHPYRGDYVALMCLRNSEKAATTYASIDTLHLDDDTLNVLFEPRFTINPDQSHVTIYKTMEQDDTDLVKHWALDRRDTVTFPSPTKVAVLFGHPRSPYMRLDPYFMDPLDADPEAQTALEVLSGEIDAHLSSVVLEPGDCCFIDNYRAVHGRKPFKARYDGRDRWLKRLNITRDLRKSRSARETSTARVLQ